VDFGGLLIPYVVLGCVVLVVFGVFWFIRLPSIDGQQGKESPAEDASVHKAPLIRQPHFTWGIVTQFLYIAAQVGVNAFAVNYILENAITRNGAGAVVTDWLFAWYGSVTRATRPEATAAYVITIAMVLYATGRFTGAAISRVIKPNLLLAYYGIANCLIILLIMADIKQVSWRILPFCWLFMSIMFPFIFAMSLRNLGPQTKMAASFHVMAVGAAGSIAAVLMGWLWDRYHNVGISFTVPLIGFIAATIYGLVYPRLLEKSGRAAVTTQS